MKAILSHLTHVNLEDIRLNEISQSQKDKWLHDSTHVVVLVVSLSLTLLQPWTIASRLLSPWDFPGKSIGVGCHFLLQGIFPALGLNSWLLHWQVEFYHEPPGKPDSTHMRNQKIVKLIETGGKIEVPRDWIVEEIASFYSTGMKSQLCKMNNPWRSTVHTHCAYKEEYWVMHL